MPICSADYVASGIAADNFTPPRGKYLPIFRRYADYSIFSRFTLIFNAGASIFHIAMPHDFNDGDDGFREAQHGAPIYRWLSPIRCGFGLRYLLILLYFPTRTPPRAVPQPPSEYARWSLIRRFIHWPRSRCETFRLLGARPTFTACYFLRRLTLFFHSA